MSTQAFTILFEFKDTQQAFSFVGGHGRFQAYVQKNNLDVPVYLVSRINRYDVYEITSLIGSYHLSKQTTASGETTWIEVRTGNADAFIQAIGLAIEQQAHAVQPAVPAY